MKKLKIAGLVFLGLIVALVLGGFAIDSEVKIETEATLGATPETVFEVLSSYEGQRKWWDEAMKEHLDESMPEMEVRHAGGPAAGKGLEVSFVAGDQVMPSKLVVEVDFQIFVVERTLLLEPAGSGTKVTWSDTAEITNPLMRYMTVLMPPEEVVKNFDGALAALDRVTSPANPS
jgi:uncharacterized protein YndB with AHSA1/START domain